MAGLDRLDPVNASRRGLGELLARYRDASRIWLGLGGSATVDGGRDWPMLTLPPTTVFCDVTTDLLDAARIYQRGAPSRQATNLNSARRGRSLPALLVPPPGPEDAADFARHSTRDARDVLVGGCGQRVEEYPSTGLGGVGHRTPGCESEH